MKCPAMLQAAFIALNLQVFPIWEDCHQVESSKAQVLATPNLLEIPMELLELEHIKHLANSATQDSRAELSANQTTHTVMEPLMLQKLQLLTFLVVDHQQLLLSEQLALHSAPVAITLDKEPLLSAHHPSILITEHKDSTSPLQPLDLHMELQVSAVNMAQLTSPHHPPTLALQDLSPAM